MILSKRYQIILKHLSEYLPNGLEGLKMLDVGDYYPNLPLYLRNKAAEVSVLDLDAPEITLNLYRKSGIKFISFDLNLTQETPIPIEEKYDIILWLEVIEHLKCSPKYVLKEFDRLLKFGGILVLGTPNAARLSARIRYLLGRNPSMFSIDAFYFGAEKFLGHRREYFIYEIDEILKWEGFTILDPIYYNGSLSDHTKQPWFLTIPYLIISFLFKNLRWLYIPIAQKTRARVEKEVEQKRV